VPRKKNPWRWSRQRELAAKLIADDQLPDLEIAKRVGVSFVTLYAWKDKPEFAGRIKELVEIHRKAFRDSVFASAAHCAAEIERITNYLKRSRPSGHGCTAQSSSRTQFPVAILGR
jgi:uncharacterized protein YjcR